MDDIIKALKDKEQELENNKVEITRLKNQNSLLLSTLQKVRDDINVSVENICQ